MSRAMETYLRTELVLKALDMALGHLRPAGADSCDQISQCTSAPLAEVETRRRAILHWIGRRLLRQCQVLNLFGRARMRTARPAQLYDRGRSPLRGL